MAETPQNLEPTQAAAGDAKPVRTHGDKLFDRWVYAGLNGVGTFIVTIPLAYWGDHGKGAAKFKEGAEWLTKHTKMNAKTAETVIGTTTLGLGGTAMVLPVFVAEHFRKPIVGWFNQHFGSEKDRTAVVENTAPQTFSSLLKGRVVAWCAVFTGFKLFGYAAKAAGNEQALDNFKTKFGEVTCKILGKDTHNEAVRAELVAGKETVEAALKGSETKAFKLAKLGALDIFATTAATSILYVTSRIFAKKRVVHQKELGQTAFVAPAALPQEMSAARVMNDNAPGNTVAGEKIHPGVVAEAPQQQAAQL